RHVPPAAALFPYTTLFRSNQVQHDRLEQREVLRRVVLADHAVIFTEADVEHPVKSVFDGPVCTHGLGQLFGGEFARADVVALFQDRKSTRLNSSHVKISYA